MATQEWLLKAAKTSGKGSKQLSGKDASAAIWGAAVGGKHAGSSNDHDGLDSALAKSMTESDVAGALDAKTFGIKLLGGLSVKPPSGKALVSITPSPATPKAKGGPPAASDDEVDAEVGEDEQGETMTLSMLFLRPRRWRSKHRCFETLQPSCASRPSRPPSPSPPRSTSDW